MKQQDCSVGSLKCGLGQCEQRPEWWEFEGILFRVDCVENDGVDSMSELKVPRFVTCIYQASVPARGKSNRTYSTKLLLVALPV